MSLEAIVQKIQADADAKAKALVAESRAKAEAITEEARTKAHAERDRLIEAARSEAIAESERALIAARLVSRRTILAAKRAHITAAFDRTRNAVEALSQTDYARLIEKIIAGQLGDSNGEWELRLSEADNRRLPGSFIDDMNSHYPFRLKRGATLDRAEGGFIMAAGPVAIDFTFSRARLLLEESLQREIAGMLFK